MVYVMNTGACSSSAVPLSADSTISDKEKHVNELLSSDTVHVSPKNMANGMLSAQPGQCVGDNPNDSDMQIMLVNTSDLPLQDETHLLISMTVPENISMASHNDNDNNKLTLETSGTNSGNDRDTNDICQTADTDMDKLHTKVTSGMVVNHSEQKASGNIDTHVSMTVNGIGNTVPFHEPNTKAVTDDSTDSTANTNCLGTNVFGNCVPNEIDDNMLNWDNDLSDQFDENIFGDDLLCDSS